MASTLPSHQNGENAFGSWHTRLVKDTRKVGQALSWATVQSNSETISHLFQRLSILLVRGNSILIVNRIPNNIPTHVDRQF